MKEGSQAKGEARKGGKEMNRLSETNDESRNEIRSRDLCHLW